MIAWKPSDGTSDAKGALSGLRVLDFSRLAPGPFATLILAEMGADVIAISRPGEEDMTHPFFRRLARDVSVDLKQPEERALVSELMQQADVVVEGFRPGVADRLGIGFADARAANLGVIYCSITGFGQGGPNRDLAGHDLNYLAMSGLSSLTGNEINGPAIPLNLVADLAGGSLQAVVSILGAIIGRPRRGQGYFLDVSMTGGVVGMLGPLIGRLQAEGLEPPAPGEHMLAGAAPYYRHYRCRDGKWLAVAAIEPKFFDNLCDALELRQLKSMHSTPEQWPTAVAALTETFAGADREHWTELLRGLDVCVTPVLSVDDAFAVSQTGGLPQAGELPAACPGARVLRPTPTAG